MHVIARYSIIL